MKITTKLSAAIMLALGFASCKFPGASMYGTPYADFKLKSEVKDKAGNPIEGIKVTASEPVYINTTTNSRGVAEVSTTIFPAEQKIMIYFTDVDGTANGSFKKDSAEVVVSKNEFSKGSGWYNGSVEKSVRVTLEQE